MAREFSMNIIAFAWDYNQDPYDKCCSSWTKDNDQDVMSCGDAYLLGHGSLCAEERAAFPFMVFFFTFTAEHKLENKPKHTSDKNTLGTQTAEYNCEESYSR